ncbi:MAG: hypothetical protein ABIE03_06645 [Patescibacteria group bacterium]|nr:hypothetical protein [Patescibacteria group bacterium]
MNKTIIIVIVVVVLLLCCCSAGGIAAYLLLNSSSTVEHEDTTETSTSTSIADNLPYTNYEHDFSLLFPNSWEGYNVDKTPGAGLEFEAYYQFKLTSSTQGEVSMFTITVYSQNDWDPMLEELGMEIKLGENSEYVYTFAQMNGIAPQDLQAAFDDIGEIKDSFQLNK